jgi:hypothetical protein
MRIMIPKIAVRLASACILSAVVSMARPVLATTLFVHQCPSCNNAQDAAVFAYNWVVYNYGFYNGGPQILYVVRSLNKAEAYAFAVYWVETVYPEGSYWTPYLDDVAVTYEEALVLDQKVSGRAMLLKDHINELPTIEFEGIQTSAFDGGAEEAVLDFMNTEPQVRLPATGVAVALDYFADSIWERIVDRLAAYLHNEVVVHDGVYMKVVFEDGSYYVVKVTPAVQTHIAEVMYKSNADGSHVVVINTDVLENVEDPALPEDPEDDAAYNYDGLPYPDIVVHVSEWSSLQYTIVNCYNVFQCQDSRAFRIVVYILGGL